MKPLTLLRHAFCAGIATTLLGGGLPASAADDDAPTEKKECVVTDAVRNLSTLGCKPPKPPPPPPVPPLAPQPPPPPPPPVPDL